jgi:hypothetical protein
MPARKYSRSRLDLASILGLFGNDIPVDNEFFGAAPGDVPFDFKGDPSALVNQPFQQPGFLDKLAGNRAGELNTQHKLSTARLQQADAMDRARMVYADTLARERIREQVAAEQEFKRQQEEERLRPGGVLDREAEAKARAEMIAKEGTASSLFPTAFRDGQAAATGNRYGAAPLLATSPSNLRADLFDLVTRQGAKNLEGGTVNAQATADRSQLNSLLDTQARDTYTANPGITSALIMADVGGKELGNTLKLQDALANDARLPYAGWRDIGGGVTLTSPNGSDHITAQPATEAKSEIVYGPNGKVTGTRTVPGKAARPIVTRDGSTYMDDGSVYVHALRGYFKRKDGEPITPPAGLGSPATQRHAPAFQPGMTMQGVSLPNTYGVAPAATETTAAADGGIPSILLGLDPVGSGNDLGLRSSPGASGSWEEPTTATASLTMPEFGPPNPEAAFRQLRQDIWRRQAGHRPESLMGMGSFFKGVPREDALTMPLFQGLAEILKVQPEQVGGSAFWRNPRSVIAASRAAYAPQFDALPDETRNSLYQRALNSFYKNPYERRPMLDWDYSLRGAPERKRPEPVGAY